MIGYLPRNNITNNLNDWMWNEDRAISLDIGRCFFFVNHFILNNVCSLGLFFIIWPLVWKDRLHYTDPTL
jgi:hypothetical protein